MSWLDEYVKKITATPLLVIGNCIKVNHCCRDCPQDIKPFCEHIFKNLKPYEVFMTLGAEAFDFDWLNHVYHKYVAKNDMREREKQNEL